MSSGMFNNMTVGCIRDYNCNFCQMAHSVGKFTHDFNNNIQGFLR